MNDELTRKDIEKMQAELDRLRSEMPAILEEVKRTRAFGDLSENFEYKAAKQAQNRNRSRTRYLEGMIKTAKVIADRSGADEVGLFDKVEIYIPEDDEEETYKIVTSIRGDSMQGRISDASPMGRALMGHKVGDTVTIRVNDTYSYEAEIRKIVAVPDDGSDAIRQY